MAKDYPERIVLKQHKCPSCGQQMGHPDLRASDIAIQAACKKEGCDFKLELFWLGDSNAWAN